MKVKASIIILLVVALLHSCTFTRAVRYWGPNITDHKVFHHTEIRPSDQVFRFHKGNLEAIDTQRFSTVLKDSSDTTEFSLDGYLEQYTTTTAFLVIRNDSILFEKYYKGYKPDSISKVFSISKSVTSLLVGIAKDEGYIESINDPVTKYVPELKKKNKNFDQLTIEHLLNMRAGFKFNENNYFPLSRATNLYYSTNHLGKVKKAKFKHKPGEVFEYQSLVTALLGVVVERATGKNLSEYLQEKVWTTLGMENRATWDIDDNRHRSNKAHVGINTTAIDLAKIGRLYLNGGNWNGTQIVSADWIAKSTTPLSGNLGYQYQWWSHSTIISKYKPSYNILKSSITFTPNSFFTDSLSASVFIKENYPDCSFVEIKSAKGKNNAQFIPVLYAAKDNQFAAEGILGQWIFVDPEKNIIMVRLGEKGDLDHYFFRAIIEMIGS